MGSHIDAAEMGARHANVARSGRRAAAFRRSLITFCSSPWCTSCPGSRRRRGTGTRSPSTRCTAGKRRAEVRRADAVRGVHARDRRAEALAHVAAGCARADHRQEGAARLAARPGWRPAGGAGGGRGGGALAAGPRRGGGVAGEAAPAPNVLVQGARLGRVAAGGGVREVAAVAVHGVGALQQGRRRAAAERANRKQAAAAAVAGQRRGGRGGARRRSSPRCRWWPPPGPPPRWCWTGSSCRRR